MYASAVLNCMIFSKVTNRELFVHWRSISCLGFWLLTSINIFEKTLCIKIDVKQIISIKTPHVKTGLSSQLMLPSVQFVCQRIYRLHWNAYIPFWHITTEFDWPLTFRLYQIKSVWSEMNLAIRTVSQFVSMRTFPRAAIVILLCILIWAL